MVTNVLGVYTIEDYEAGNCQKKQIGRAKRSSEREIIGKGVPDWTGSMINTLRYKNWDFTWIYNLSLVFRPCNSSITLHMTVSDRLTA